jgi:hypothetical protein
VPARQKQLKQNRMLGDIIAKPGVAMIPSAPWCAALILCRTSEPEKGDDARPDPTRPQELRSCRPEAGRGQRGILPAPAPARSEHGGVRWRPCRIKVGAALAGLVGSLGQLDRIRPQLQALGRERARQGVQAEAYAKLGDALIGALEQALADDFDQETRRAWISAYGMVARIMMGGADSSRLAAQAA